MPENNPLKVPYLPQLEQLSVDEKIKTLDELGNQQIIDNVNWPKEYPYHPLTAFSIAHTGKSIIIDFAVRCNYLRAVNYLNNSPVHEDSCVEFFVAPRGRQPYYNFEFNCIGTPHVACRMDRHNGKEFSDEQLAQIKRYPSCGTRPFEEVQGMFSWNLMVEIPLSLMDVTYEGKPIQMMANFYKCADLTSSPHFLSWAPISTPQPDFHRPEFFQPIVLE